MCGWCVSSRAHPCGMLLSIFALTSWARLIVSASGFIRMSIAVRSLMRLGPLLEDGAPVVFHAHDRPAQVFGLGERFLGAVGVGELAVLVVVVDEHRERRGGEHLDVHVRVAAAEHGQPAGRSEDVLWLASAD